MTFKSFQARLYACFSVLRTRNNSPVHPTHRPHRSYRHAPYTAAALCPLAGKSGMGSVSCVGCYATRFCVSYSLDRGLPHPGSNRLTATCRKLWRLTRVLAAFYAPNRGWRLSLVQPEFLQACKTPNMLTIVRTTTAESCSLRRRPQGLADVR
jgi:hypothetical protein